MSGKMSRKETRHMNKVGAKMLPCIPSDEQLVKGNIRIEFPCCLRPEAQKCLRTGNRISDP